MIGLIVWPHRCWVVVRMKWILHAQDDILHQHNWPCVIMRPVTALSLLTLLVSFGNSEILSNGEADRQLQLYKQRVSILSFLIKQKCPGKITVHKDTCICHSQWFFSVIGRGLTLSKMFHKEAAPRGITHIQHCPQRWMNVQCYMHMMEPYYKICEFFIRNACKT